MSYPTFCFLSYNRPAFLEQALFTAISGADEPVEVIVHDDGSTADGLVSALTTWQQAGLISTLILNAPGVNQGQGVALNRMFRMATGDPIIKLDHDLVFKPGWLSKVDAVLRDERVGLCALFRYWHDPVDYRKTRISDEELIAAGAPLPGSGYSFHTHIIGSGFALRRATWEELGPFPERWESFGEDWEMQKRVHASDRWFNAVPDDDLVENVGFGIGPSTVVVQGDQGRPEPSKIHKGPMLVGGD